MPAVSIGPDHLLVYEVGAKGYCGAVVWGTEVVETRLRHRPVLSEEGTTVTQQIERNERYQLACRLQWVEVIPQWKDVQILLAQIAART